MMIEQHSSNVEAAPDPFEAAVIRYKKGEGPIDDVYRLGMPVFARLGQSAAYSHGIPEERDEVGQELALLFFTRILRDYDMDVSIFPYMRTFADNLARTLLRKKRDNPNATDIFGDPEDDGLDPVVSFGLLRAGIDGGESGDPIDGLITRLDKESALKRIGERLYPERNSTQWTRTSMPKKPSSLHKSALPEVGFFVERAPGPALKNPSAPGLTVEEAKTRTGFAKRRNTVEGTKAELTPDQKELRGIRIELGMSQPKFAEAIGIELPRLSAYEYGRTSGVRDYVLEAARDLRERVLKQRKSVLSVYEGKSMSEIVDHWREQLAKAMVVDGSLPPETERVSEDILASSLNVTRTTVKRWIDGDAKPSLDTILRHNEIIAFIAAQRQARADRKGSGS